MGLKETGRGLCALLQQIAHDLTRADVGNKAAAQRVRTATIRFEKLAKMYRKESVQAAKSGELKRVKASAKKKKVAKPAKPAKAKASAKAKPAKVKARGHVKKRVVTKPKAKKKVAKPRSLAATKRRKR